MRFRAIIPILMMIVVLACPVLSCGGDAPPPTRESAMDVRPFAPFGDGFGHAVCYGPHRDGQRPGGASPSTAEIVEDLRLMRPHWSLLRLYGASETAETVLAAIRAEELDMKVMLGAWIEAEETPEKAANNRTEVEAAIRLAAEYPGIVVAVCVGNETQVDWAAHRCDLEVLLRHLRAVREGVEVPVTTADDFAYWLLPESRALAAEIDFITMHAHPMWNGRRLDEGLPWIDEQLAAVRALHPDRDLVLGETGWATSAHDEGEQARLIKGRPGEAEQKIFHDRMRAWAEASRLTVFVFEAFDENWKGGPHADEVEKHWGLFRADRTPKAAVAGR